MSFFKKNINKSLSEQNKSLTEQNKSLTEQNKSLKKEHERSDDSDSDSDGYYDAERNGWWEDGEFIPDI